MRSGFCVVALGAIVWSGCEGSARVSAPQKAVAELSSGIAANGDPAVVDILYLFNAADGTTTGYNCTGTLFSAHAVVTAGHCAHPVKINPDGLPFCSVGPCPSPSFQVLVLFHSSESFQATLDAGKYATVDAFAAAPNYVLASMGQHKNDLGLLHIKGNQMANGTSLPAPLTLNQQPLGPVTTVLPSVRLVGYGATDQQGTGRGVKRQATKLNVRVITISETAEKVTSTDLGLPQAGDSGAPLLMVIDGVERVIAVNSRGDANSATNTRVDYYRDFINDFLASHGEPGLPAWNAPRSPVLAFEAGGMCTPCSKGDECSGGTGACVTEDSSQNNGLCAPSCQTDAQCVPGTRCFPLAAGNSVCYPAFGSCTRPSWALEPDAGTVEPKMVEPDAGPVVEPMPEPEPEVVPEPNDQTPPKTGCTSTHLGSPSLLIALALLVVRRNRRG
jgi:hypothetical protein